MTTGTMAAVAVVMAVGAALLLRPDARMEPVAAGDPEATGEIQGAVTSGDPQVSVGGPVSKDDQERTNQLRVFDRSLALSRFELFWYF